MSSHYENTNIADWKKVTQKLIDSHPLSECELVKIVLKSWDSLFASRFGTAGFAIGKHIFPKPQTMGVLLHELIPLELESMHQGKWKVGFDKNDKDCLCIADNKYSFEIKTSSSANEIFGNRSYAQKNSNSRKAKDGFYLTVNFGKFSKRENQPTIKSIRFGWLDATDWIGQKATTGQKASLPPEVYDGKLKLIYES